MPVPRPLARVLVGMWLRTSSDSWTRRIVARDSPHVHAPGTNADRVLLVGDGVATGRGVTTHELGLPGFLARALSAQTGHATDVDVDVDQRMTVSSVRQAIDGANLARYDMIIISVGHNEALSLMSVSQWRDGLGDLLDDLARKLPVRTPVRVLAVPVFGPGTALPGRLARVVDAHVATMNRILQAAIGDRAGVKLIDPSSVHQFEPESTPVYKRWAEHIAREVGGSLSADRVIATTITEMDEMHRQLALEELEESGMGSDDALDDLLASARTVFGAPVAAVTFIHSDYQTMRAVSGMEAHRLPRDQAFCDVTIRRSSHFVIEDTWADTRYAEYSMVTGEPKARFYAGYPIESPGGYRVGTFCVMDTVARAFSTRDLELLRSMAQLAEQRLWPAA